MTLWEVLTWDGTQIVEIVEGHIVAMSFGQHSLFFCEMSGLNALPNDVNFVGLFGNKWLKNNCECNIYYLLINIAWLSLRGGPDIMGLGGCWFYVKPLGMWCMIIPMSSRINHS